MPRGFWPPLNARTIDAMNKHVMHSSVHHLLVEIFETFSSSLQSSQANSKERKCFWISNLWSPWSLKEDVGWPLCFVWSAIFCILQKKVTSHSFVCKNIQQIYGSALHNMKSSSWFFWDDSSRKILQPRKFNSSTLKNAGTGRQSGFRLRVFGNFSGAFAVNFGEENMNCYFPKISGDFQSVFSNVKIRNSVDLGRSEVFMGQKFKYEVCPRVKSRGVGRWLLWSIYSQYDNIWHNMYMNSYIYIHTYQDTCCVAWATDRTAWRSKAMTWPIETSETSDLVKLVCQNTHRFCKANNPPKKIPVCWEVWRKKYADVEVSLHENPILSRNTSYEEVNMNKTEKLMDSQYESLDHLGITPRALSQNKQELSLVPTMVWQEGFSNIQQQPLFEENHVCLIIQSSN